MEAFSALRALCAGNSPVTGEFPAQRPVIHSFDVFFYLRLNKRLSKQSLGWWFETPLCSSWRHCNGVAKPLHKPALAKSNGTNMRQQALTTFNDSYVDQILKIFLSETMYVQLHDRWCAVFVSVFLGYQIFIDRNLAVLFRRKSLLVIELSDWYRYLSCKYNLPNAGAQTVHWEQHCLHDYSEDTLRNNDVVIKSKRRHFDVITSKWRRFDIITLFLRHMFGG